MEWQGIDLSGSAQSKWVFTSHKNIINTLFILLLAVGISLGLTFYHSQKKQEIIPLVEELRQLNNQTVAIKNKIFQLQNNNDNPLPFIKKAELEKFLILIKKLPLKNGGIESIQIYLEPQLYVKISGKFSTEEDFPTLESYLKKIDFIEMKTDHITLNQHNETDFILTLKYKGE